jgi:hypothetical protein
VSAHGPLRRPAGPATPEYPDDAALDETIALLRAAQRPVAIVGGGARSANAVYLFRELTAMLELPHTATINGLGCATPGDPRFLGMLGMHGWKAANLAVNSADVLLALGMRFDDRVTGKPDRFARGTPRSSTPTSTRRSSGRSFRSRSHSAATCAKRWSAAWCAGSGASKMPSFAGWAAEAKALGGALPADRAPHGELSATDVLDAFFAVAPTTRSSRPTSASIRCGPRNASARSTRATSSPRPASARWASACRRRSARSSRTPIADGRGGLRRRRLSDVDVRARDAPRHAAAGEDLADRQPAARHGAPVARAVLRAALLAHRSVRQSRLRHDRERLRHPGRAVEDAGELRDAIERFLGTGTRALALRVLPGRKRLAAHSAGATVDDAMEGAPQEAIVA